MTIETSPSIENLAAALGKFQAETHGVVRDAINPFHKSRYATLEAVIETARPGLTKAGLSFLQAPAGLVSGSVELTTMLMHGGSGEWVRFTTAMPLQKPDPQSVGSAITYAARYALMAMLGLPPLDDDAEAAKQPQPKTPPHMGSQHLPPPHTPAHNPALKKIEMPVGGQSKAIYVESSLERIAGFDSAAKLLEWAKTERERVWPQYGIDAHDPDGQRIVKVYKGRMAVLEEKAV